MTSLREWKLPVICLGKMVGKYLFLGAIIGFKKWNRKRVKKL